MSDFWADQRVLVTGGTGFLGRHILNQLHYAGAEYGMPKRSETDLRHTRGINGPEGLIVNHSFNLVIHCAARVGGIGLNQQQPATLFYDNLLMNTHVLHEAYTAGVQKFVGIGSVCAYPKHTPTPFREYNLFNGYPEATNAPYGITKRALLVMGQAYRQQYGFNAIHLLMANLYGPGDHFEPERSHVIPALIRRFQEAKVQALPSVTLWGSGQATREFLYVEDGARAVVAAAEHYDAAEPLNIGTGVSVSIELLAHLIRELVGYTGAINWDPSKPDGQPKRQLDIRRALKVLGGWSPQMTLGDGLEKTVRWYEAEVVGV